MRKTILAGVLALVGFWLFAASFRGQRLPSHTATATLPALGLTVTAELFPLSDLTEFERHLTLAAADGATLRVRMEDVRGPADRMGLYRVGGEAEVAVQSPAGGDGGGQFFAAEPLRRLDGPSRPSADWTCLGAFELSMVPNGGDPARGRAQVFTFTPAAPEGAGRSCPLPRPTEGGGAPGKAPRS